MAIYYYHRYEKEREGEGEGREFHAAKEEGGRPPSHELACLSMSMCACVCGWEGERMYV